MGGTADIRTPVSAVEPTTWGAVVAAHGELDVATAPALRERLGEAVARGVQRLVVDMSGVTFVDSISLAAVLAARRQMGEGGRLALVAPEGSYVLLIVEAGGLDSVVEIYPSRSAAEAALAG